MPDANPGISFKVGQSHTDLTQLKRDLQDITATLQQMRQAATEAGASVNGLNARRGIGAGGTPPLGPSHAGGGRGTGGGTTPPAHEEDRQRPSSRYRYAGGNTSSSHVYRDRNEPSHSAQERQSAPPKGTGRNGRGGATEGGGALGGLINAASWSPFTPQSGYYLQMMLESMGLSTPLIAAGMGIAGVGGGALAANAFAVEQQRTGEQLVTATGAPPTPFLPNTYVTAAQESQTIQEREQTLHLSGQQGTQATSALAGGGLDSTQAFGTALDQTAVLVNAFGMSVSDAASYITTLQTDMGDTSGQITASLQSLAKTADATGIPLQVLGQIVEQTPNMLANLAGNPSDFGPAAAVARAVGGSTQGAIQVASVANASGGQALSIASQMGLNDQQFNQLQSSKGGQKSIDDFLVSTVKSAMTQSGGAVDQAMLEINGRFGTNFDKATLERINNLPTTATTTAYNNAVQNPPAIPPGGAQSFLQQIISGNLTGASATANPWNVKDLTVTAAQVWLTGAVNQAGNIGQIVTNSSAMSTAQLEQIVSQGGAASVAARVALLARGEKATPTQLSNATRLGQAPPLLDPNGYNITLPPASTASATTTSTPGPTVNPGGSGGSTGMGVFTLNLVMDGQSVAAIPVSIQAGKNQQYTQYVRRGQQYR